MNYINDNQAKQAINQLNSSCAIVPVPDIRLGSVFIVNRAAEIAALIQDQSDRLKMYKDGLYMPTGEITDEYISEFLRSLPTGSIWYFIACKWDAMIMLKKAQKEKIELLKRQINEIRFNA